MDDNAQFSMIWQQDLTDVRSFVNDVIDRWRGEVPQVSPTLLPSINWRRRALDPDRR
jgi:hypothetical protein